MIELKATATKLTCLKPVDISCFVQNEVRVHVHLDRSWDGLTAYLTFKAGDVQKDCPYPYTGNYVPIPPELMVEENIGKIIQIGLAGYDGETTVRSLWCDAGRVFRGILYGTSAVPTMDMLQAIRKDNDETEHAVREMTYSVLAGIKTVEDTAARLDVAVEAAKTSAEAAETSKTAASESATAADGSAAAAASSETAAKTAQTSAQTAASEAADSETAAAQSAAAAADSASAAESSASTAAASQRAAAESEKNAKSSETAASSSASAAAGSERAAAASASEAEASKTTAVSSASSASDSADRAMYSASSAESAASDAAASQAATQTAADAAQNAKNAAESANTAAQAAKTAAESANDNAQDAKTAAESAQSGAEDAKTSAASSASAAASHASSAANSAESATNSADAAEKSSKAAKTSETNAAGSATAAASSKNEAAASAANAAASSGEAKSSSASAASSAETAKSWAIGGTGTRAGEDTDNAKYYAGTAKASADAASGHSSTAAAKASDAASSASNAADSAAAAKTSEDNARAAQAAAEEAKDKATEIVGGDFATNQQVAAAVSTHNESADAHADLREIVRNHTESKNNPHGVTKAQIGLGSVDNTSDANKPVSTAQAAEIADAKKAGTDAQSALGTHKSDTTVHITAAERTAWNAKGSYSKPSGGIPKTDLAADVQTSIGHADSAYSDVSGVKKLIPAQASESNQLADQAMVNSSIATNTAYYISDNGSPFPSLAALQAYTGTLTNNDYAFVVGTDAAGNTQYTRYKYNSATQAWSEEYVLNNSSFTAEQWAAIQSGITGEQVAQIAQNATAIQTINNQKGAAGGIAELDANGKLKAAQKPSYTASEVGARPSTWTPSASDVGAVPTSRKVNGKTLSADITLGAADVGARPSTWTPTASDVGAIASPANGTAGQILTKTASGAAWEDAPKVTAELHVTTNAGVVVTATKGSKVLSATADSSGLAVLYPDELGTWTLKATINGKTLEVPFVIDAIAVFNTSLTTDLEDASWGYISTVAEAGNAASVWSVGAKKTIKLNGVSYTAQIIGFNHDTKTAGGKAGITFQLVDCLNTSYQMNSSNTNVGGWKSSAMRSRMSEFLGQLDEDLQSVIKPVNKLVSIGNKTSTIETVSDKLFLLSEVEIFGSTTYSFAGEGSQYDWYKAGNTRVKKVNGSARYWWERSPCSDYTNYFCYVNSNGNANRTDASDSLSVSFGFCV